jgi:hypothetical protein
MVHDVAHQALVQRLRGGEVRPDGAEGPERPERLEEALDGRDVDVDEEQRQAQPRGAGCVEQVEALPDGVGAALREEDGGGRGHEGRGGGHQAGAVQQDLADVGVLDGPGPVDAVVDCGLVADGPEPGAGAAAEEGSSAAFGGERWVGRQRREARLVAMGEREARNTRGL